MLSHFLEGRCVLRINYQDRRGSIQNFKSRSRGKQGGKERGEEKQREIKARRSYLTVPAVLLDGVG